MPHVVLTATIVVLAQESDISDLEDYRKMCENHLLTVLSNEDAFSGNGDTESVSVSSVLVGEPESPEAQVRNRNINLPCDTCGAAPEEECSYTLHGAK